MKNGIATWAGAGLLLLFAGVFIWAGGSGKAARSELPAQQQGVKGNSGRYLYAITDIQSQNKKLAQFDPTLPTDDSVVLGTLKLVAKDAYGLKLSDDVQPVVESRNEINYVTFATNGKKIYFELFRNSNGQVGSARLWIE